MNTQVIDTYTVRSMWEGTLLNEENHIDEEAANEHFENTEKFYLNAPNSDDAVGVTIQMFRESDDSVIREITF